MRSREDPWDGCEGDGFYAHCFRDFAPEGGLLEQVDVWRIDRKLIALTLGHRAGD